METSKVNDDGTVTIPKAICENLGIHTGAIVEFFVAGYQLEVRVQGAKRPDYPDVPKSGYGMIQSKRPAVPVDFDPAELLK
ncbi:looped-hinge helix DNA binding domain-containing protein, AbrB family [Duganella sacchari]|uniref:Looped-hinge helix DNA binding domain-containing protein, AbrB family n=1 Tax=Duganella sacchari TaxID=551987 RepID=A0A1M7R640_9BURK|nr:AbrB/MazE/SpoVT family DNA-binding domain-containing protein [Duganella sacchari]SHN40825.1 looped-hinge helix DNA binding domain-containing protein, AbrB family [Duganella sacchari]